MPPNELKSFLDIHGLKSVIHKIKQSKDYKQVSINILSMLIIQCSNLLIPLITFPYLIRTLGIESYGLMTFTQNIVSYGEQFINYGFVLNLKRHKKGMKSCQIAPFLSRGKHKEWEQNSEEYLEYKQNS